jgi:hypothetical protein
MSGFGWRISTQRRQGAETLKENHFSASLVALLAALSAFVRVCSSIFLDAA